MSAVFQESFNHAKLVMLDVSLSTRDLYAVELSRLNLPKALENAHPRRVLEFKIGRLCALLAIKELTGREDCEIGVGSQREPLWPDDLVGSISHSKEQACAVVARKSEVGLLGVDLEQWPRVREELSSQICTDDELADLLKDSTFGQQEILTLIFSIKEALYKALYPSVRHFFGFKAARVRSISKALVSGQGLIEVELLEQLSEEFGPMGVKFFHGRYCIRQGVVQCSFEI